ncbi:MAG: hypothetical protein IPO98_07175 [Saprospiraceae bacterium]|nr:hypothetical protein [Saprospiraceae bacterium]
MTFISLSESESESFENESLDNESCKTTCPTFNRSLESNSAALLFSVELSDESLLVFLNEIFSLNIIENFILHLEDRSNVDGLNIILIPHPPISIINMATMIAHVGV